MNEFPLTIHLRTRFGIWCSLFANPEYSFFFFFLELKSLPHWSHRGRVSIREY